MVLKSFLSLQNYISAIFLFLLVNCTTAGPGGQTGSLAGTKEFADYWYQGKAELTHYRLEQARYGQIHSGDAVLIFVTEDFLPDKQVKYEFGPKPEDVQTVMKLNATRHFYTGIYPYSVITSSFTPVDLNPGNAIKVTSSTQEWCGQTYMQVNRRHEKYEGFYHSYFQAEADQKFELEPALFEDEVWTKIRLNPNVLPIGEIDIIPGFLFLRLRHQKIDVKKAVASMSTEFDSTLSQDTLRVYRIEYKDIERTLEIKFEPAFPFKIAGWEESTLSGFQNPKKLTTRAVRTHSLNTDYWNKHSVADSTYRKQLGL